MKPREKSVDNSLEKIYLEASQWVRLANTVFWTMGTFLVPISFGFVGLALNKSPDTQFSPTGKLFLGFGSIFLFSFWVYASSQYRRTSGKAREVLVNIERAWRAPKEMSFYTKQQGLVGRPLFVLQLISLGILVAVWLIILISPTI